MTRFNEGTDPGDDGTRSGAAHGFRASVPVGDDDAEVAEDARFDDYLRGALRVLDPVPNPPVEAMWREIDAARRDRRGAPGTRRSVLRWGGPGIAAAAGIAAVLVIGIAIGRTSMLLRPGATTAQVAAADAIAADAAPFRLAALDHLTRTEALLTVLPSSTQTGSTDEVVGWASDLLAQTRLLMDSPVGDDQEIGRLLQDLELLLAQIAALDAGRSADDLDIIRDGMNQNDVLPRLRTVMNSRPFVGV